MRETSIHDLKNKLIYEGDIVKTKKGDEYYVEHTNDFLKWMKDTNLQEKDIHVVGNKFETREKMLKFEM